MKNRPFLLALAPLFLMASCIELSEQLPGGITQTENAQFIAFEPADDAETGFIFYPGALVPPESYNTWMEELARLGHVAVTARMPLNLAFTDVTAAVRIRNQFPEVDRWVIGGHSLGGAMAAQLIASAPNSGLFQGLALLGSYPSADLSAWQGSALALYGTNDGVSTPDEVLGGLTFLPPAQTIAAAGEIGPGNQTWVHAIEGGNHAQFGNYGIQAGDGEATISAVAQQAIIVEFLDRFLDVAGQ